MERDPFATKTRVSDEGRNPNVVDLSDQFRDRSNGEFFAEARRLIDAAGADDARFAHRGRAAIGLLGEYGWIGMTIREAQRHIRLDRLPSYWSHAFLFYDEISADPHENRSRDASPWIWESSLEPAPPFNLFVERNGVAPRRLADYDHQGFSFFRAHNVPNVAVIVFGMSDEDVREVLARANNPDTDRLRFDLVALLGIWYAYITNQAVEPNPLTTGSAIFCSAFVQLAYEAADIDLAVAAHSRNTSPEHIWQTAVQFHKTYADLGHPIRAYYCIRDTFGGGFLSRGQTWPRTLEELMRQAPPPGSAPPPGPELQPREMERAAGGPDEPPPRPARPRSRRRR